MLAALAPQPENSFSFTAERNLFLKALLHTQNIVERRNTVPILANVLVKNSGGLLSLTATDMDLDIVEGVPSVECSDGATTLPVHMLCDIVRKLPDGSQITLKSDGDRAELACGRSQFTLPCLPVEDFPVIGQGNLPHSFSMPVADLKELIDHTKFAMSTEETRYFLNGLFFHVAVDGESQENVLRIVATDGHRLAQAQVPLPEGAAEIPAVIIPRKTVVELRKLLDEVNEPITIGISQNKISFAFGGVRLTSKLIDGTFPDYKKVIPQNNDKILTVNTKAFAEAVDRVATISTDKIRAIKLHITSSQITLTAAGADSGRAQEELETVYGGQTLEIGFNSRYLLDIIAQIQTERTALALSDVAAPTIVTEPNSTDALYVIMPMRV